VQTILIPRNSVVIYLFFCCCFFNAFSGCEPLTEWEYLPPVGPRPTKGFVGLKNAGATCYMNSVIQQLYMIPPIRNGILAIEGTGSDVDDDMSGDEKQDNEVLPNMVHSVHENFCLYLNASKKHRPYCAKQVSLDMVLVWFT